MPRLKTYRLTQNTREEGGFLVHMMGMGGRGGQHSAATEQHTDLEAIAWATDQINTTQKLVDLATDVWQLRETFKTRGKHSRPVASFDGELLAVVRRQPREIAVC